jgi:hypothetical protein
MELEENTRRKDLTPYELSKKLVRQVEKTAPVMLPPRITGAW